jgi:hypothetical protein
MQCVQIARHLAFPRASFGIAKVIFALFESAPMPAAASSFLQFRKLQAPRESGKSFPSLS